MLNIHYNKVDINNNKAYVVISYKETKEIIIRESNYAKYFNCPRKTGISTTKRME